MNIENILACYNREVRIELEEPGLEREVLPHVIRLTRRDPPMGFIRHSRLDETNVETEIRQQIDYFVARQMPFEWVVYDYDTPKDLRARLLSHGFKPDLADDDPGATLVLDIKETPASLLEPVTADVRILDRHAELRDVVRIEEAVWGEDFDWLKSRLAAHMAIPEYLSVFVAYVNAQPASCGWIYYYPHSQFAILRGGSTVLQMRQRGLYHAVISARVQQALRRGYRYVIVDAAPRSRPILEKNGFRLLTYAQSFKWRDIEVNAP